MEYRVIISKEHVVDWQSYSMGIVEAIQMAADMLCDPYYSGCEVMVVERGGEEPRIVLKEVCCP